MSDRKPLMPKATAVWLVENTSLSFEQIAEFCGLHVLEVKGIADGDVAQGIKGLDPVTSGQLTREEIEAAEEDHVAPAQDRRAQGRHAGGGRRKKGPRYTPVSRRHDRPTPCCGCCATIPSSRTARSCASSARPSRRSPQIKDRTHWNSPNLVPQDPVTLGLCSQIDLDAEVKKAARRVERERKEASARPIKAGTLLPTEETTAPQPEPKAYTPTAEIVQPKEAEETREETPAEEEARVFAKLKELKSDDEDEKVEADED